MDDNNAMKAATVLALNQFKGPATTDEIAALVAIYHPILVRLEAVGGLRPYREWRKAE